MEALQKEPGGIQNGMSGGQWHSYLNVSESADASTAEADLKPHLISSFSSIGMDSVEFIQVNYSNDSLFRLQPTLRLGDLADSTFMPLLSASLASKVAAIHVYANGYKIQECDEAGFRIDESAFDLEASLMFTSEELADRWVRIRPKNGSSSFHISFLSYTPKRLFESPITSDSLADRRTKRD